MLKVLELNRERTYRGGGRPAEGAPGPSGGASGARLTGKAGGLGGVADCGYAARIRGVSRLVLIMKRGLGMKQQVTVQKQTGGLEGRTWVKLEAGNSPAEKGVRSVHKGVRSPEQKNRILGEFCQFGGHHTPFEPLHPIASYVPSVWPFLNTKNAKMPFFYFTLFFFLFSSSRKRERGEGV